ncbi:MULTISPECIES: PKD domain-containing protein [unclassified Microbulbifer]|uniref:PKD domain-containing protein n=1 Tax=unclassified Microbulbifer TaxID=2619833 RepID=UPI0027E580C7|nr:MULTISPECIES: PKD domain-containing protein [unclassified Microbulbifer]
MKHLPVCILCLLYTFSLVPDALAAGTSVRVDKIRYCRTIWPVCNDKLQSDYQPWEDHGVPDQIQKNTYIGKYNEPSRSEVEHIVFLASGQRFDGIDDNLLTGQPDTRKFEKQESGRTLSVSTESLAYKLFSQNIYPENNTFSALAVDARFNWGFSKDNKRDIVNAYFTWLKGKFYNSNLKSVYLAGHSRGGALVMRLAKKFQREFPDVAVIVHTFDPVTNKKEGELGATSGYIDNPEAGYPRDTILTQNKGNWGWTSDFRTFYDNKQHFSVSNYLVGGKIFGLAQEVRAVTHKSGTGTETDLGWYSQRWYSMPQLGFSAENAGGHVEIAKTYVTVNAALKDVKDNLAILTNNIAPSATASASSTYCASSGLHCYSPGRVNDKNMDSRVGGYYSWTNGNTSLPQWVQLRWPEPIKTEHIEIITSEGYPIQNYRLQYWDGSAWRTLQSIYGNQQLRIAHEFNEIETTQIRLLGLVGPVNQPAHVRVNEILVNGTWVNPPNKPPVARCSATPNLGTGVVYSELSGSGSYDTDGSIRSYHWRFSDGGSATGKVVHHTFVGRDPSITEIQRATLTVTDNDGAKDSASCIVTVRCSTGAGPRSGEPVDTARACALQ